MKVVLLRAQFIATLVSQVLHTNVTDKMKRESWIQKYFVVLCENNSFHVNYSISNTAKSVYNTDQLIPHKNYKFT